MRATFDVNVARPERKDRTAAGDAVAQMATPDKACTPIPITRAKEPSLSSAPFVERRTDALRLELGTQLQLAEDAEKRFLRSLSKTQAEVVTLSSEVQSALRRLTSAEQQLVSKQRTLRQLIKKMSVLDKERQTVTKAREALEGLKVQYDEYYRQRALRMDTEEDPAAQTKLTQRGA
jgi:hypothetical protein